MADRFLRTGGGSVNWNSTGSWSATSGGSTGASFPVAGDRVFLDANSGAGTLNVNVSAACADFDCTGYTGTLAGVNGLTISGLFKFVPGMTMSWTGSLSFNATTGPKVITSAGKTITGATDFSGVGGSYQLADDFLCLASLNHNNGALDLNGHALTCLVFATSNTNTRSINSGVAGGKIKTTNTSAITVWNSATITNLSLLNLANWSIEIGGNTVNSRSFAGGGGSYPQVTFTNTTANGTLNFTGSGNTFRAIKVSSVGGGNADSAQSITFTGNTTTTISNSGGFPKGTSGNVVTINGSGGVAHFVLTGGGLTAIVSSDFLNLQKTDVSPVGAWAAGHNSTDSGQNTGWIFGGDLFLDGDAETLTASESSTSSLFFADGVTESGNSTETESALASAVGVGSEALAAAETATGTASDVASEAEVLAVAETAVGVASDIATLAETLSAQETNAALQTAEGLMAEVLAAAESESAITLFQASQDEVGDAEDLVVVDLNRFPVRVHIEFNPT